MNMPLVRTSFPSSRKHHEGRLLICPDLVVAAFETEEPVSLRTCLHNSGLLLATARKEGWRVVHVFRDHHRPVPIDTMRPMPDEPVYQCPGPSALSAKGLRDMLVADPPEQLVLIGRDLMPSCLATAVAAADIGVNLVLVSDAVSHAFEAGDGADVGHHHAAMSLIPQFADVTTTSRILGLPATLSILSSGH